MRRKTNRIIVIIVMGLIIAGIGSWYLWLGTANEPPEQTNGQENELVREEPYEESQIDEGGLEITEALRSDIDAGYLILVNRNHGLDRDYRPDDLVGIRYYAADRTPEARFMRATAANAFHDMVYAARRQGIEFVMTTAYRSYGFQSTLYNNHVATHGQEAADRFSARPGHSEHQTGLAVDVSAASVNFQLRTAFSDTKEGRWIAENAHLFGFIIRYPESKEELTGFQYEPWHVRYVGLPAAAYIYTHGIILEEFLERLEQASQR